MDTAKIFLREQYLGPSSRYHHTQRFIRLARSELLAEGKFEPQAIRRRARTLPLRYPDTLSKIVGGTRDQSEAIHIDS